LLLAVPPWVHPEAEGRVGESLGGSSKTFLGVPFWAHQHVQVIGLG